jgi:HTH-type transcriptional regulator, glycine betaine synthesis regulator
VAFFSEVVQVLGVPRSVGQIYGLLYATPEPLSFSDIVERLEISKGSASQGLQLLRSLGSVRVVEQSDGCRPIHFPSHVHSQANVSRRAAYEPELSLRKLVSGVLQERIIPLAVAGADRLTRLRELAEEDGEENDFYLDRAKQLNTWRRRLKTVLPMLDTLLGPKSRK